MTARFGTGGRPRRPAGDSAGNKGFIFRHNGRGTAGFPVANRFVGEREAMFQEQLGAVTQAECVAHAPEDDEHLLQRGNRTPECSARATGRRTAQSRWETQVTYRP